MAKMVLTAEYVGLAGTDYGAYFSSAELSVDVEDKETTNFGSGGWKEFLGGLKSGQIKLNLLNDVAAASVDSVLWPLLGTVVAFELRTSTAVVGTSNPKWTGSFVMTQYSPIGGSVGDVNSSGLSWPTTGAITRATA